MADVAPSAERWWLADSVVLAGICLVAAALFFPAICNSRYAAQLAGCQNNLRQIGFAMQDYSEKAGAGYFPSVPPSGRRAFAGVYGPVLLEGGYLPEPRVLLCPASLVVVREPDFRVPTLAQIDNADAKSAVVLQARAGGSYGYSLGVVVNGKYEPPRRLGRATFALMSDVPVQALLSLTDANHGGQGYNFLFEDAHVRFLKLSEAEAVFLRDDPFRNRRGVVEAGVDEDDAVIGPSAAAPFLTSGVRF
jgi:hypothetical protein